MTGEKEQLLRAVILCGGSGTRLWPLSRAQYPKQFLPLIDEHSLLQATLLRLQGLPNMGVPLLVSNDAQRFLVAEQLRLLDLTAEILLEPAARNTAPAIAAAAAWAVPRTGAATLLLVLPSDHVVQDVEAFQLAVRAAIPHAQAGRLVTFGIVPTRPETGYGYIKRGGAVEGGFAVDRFVEKPDAETAGQYVESGEYYWNSGMFLFQAGRYLQELTNLAPDVANPAMESAASARTDLDFVRLEASAFERCRADSIDYALMEKTREGVVIPLAAGWNDIGAWDALCQEIEEDGDGNACRGDVIAYRTENSLIRAESRLVATVGVSGLIVVETADAVLVASKECAQDVKYVVERLKNEQRAESDCHTRVFRPWGSYEGIALGSRYQVKRIVVKPGCSLSLQMHHHRAEHWVVVKGTAKVQRGEEILMLTENQSTYIPLGEIHRLENPGKIDLEIVEIQSGAYLGEDDIVRLEDNYGRSK